MSDEVPLSPIAPPEAQSAPSLRGRPADLIATLMATLGAVLGVLAALWFFLGFAENDLRPEHLLSAVLLTFSLFVFAVGPFALVADFARRAYLGRGQMRHYLWTIFLMLPWIGLAWLSLTRTPLPAWVSLLALGLSGLLCLWAVICLVLDRRARGTPDAPNA